MEKKKHLVKIALYNSDKTEVKYLNHDSELSRSITLFTDLKELEKNLETFFKHFNKQKIEEICNNCKCNKEEIKVETLKNKTDSWWTTIMFKIIVKDGFAPMYILKYMIIDKQ